MRRILLYIGLFAAAWMIPAERTDLGKLKPVETVCICEVDGLVTVKTDTEDEGSGETLEKAIQNMKETASGIIYLDTADYLLVEEGMEAQIPEIRGLLKDDVRICNAEKGMDVTQAASYLSVHKPEWTMKMWYPQAELQVLRMENERLKLG